MPLNSNALTTLSALQDALGSVDPQDDNADLDSIHGRAINAVSAAFERATNRKLVYQVDYVQDVETYGNRSLFVHRFPLKGVTAINHVLSDGTTGATLTTNWRLNKEAGIIYPASFLPWSTWGDIGLTQQGLGRVGHEEPAIRVTYTGGYVTPQQLADDPTLSGEEQLPTDVEEVIIESCVRWLTARSQSGHAEIQSVSADDLSTQFGLQHQRSMHLLSQRAHQLAKSMRLRQ